MKRNREQYILRDTDGKPIAVGIGACSSRIIDLALDGDGSIQNIDGKYVFATPGGEILLLTRDGEEVSPLSILFEYNGKLKYDWIMDREV